MNIDTSVATISKECNDLIDVARSGTYNDAIQFADILEERVTELNKLFNEHPEDYNALTRAKTSVESMAIRLELYCDIHYQKYHDRVQLRKEIARIYEDIKTVMLEQKDMEDKNELIQICADCKFVLNLLYNTSHIAFYLDKQDEQRFKEVIVHMSKYLKE